MDWVEKNAITVCKIKGHRGMGTLVEAGIAAAG